MRQYLDLIKDVLENGEQRMDRTGTGTISVFGRHLRFNLQEGFPAVTTKRLFIKGVWVELLWMLSGSSNIDFMLDHNVHIWDEWADSYGDLGPVYGVQWRRWRHVHWEGLKAYRVEYIDQLQKAIDTIKSNPTDRRMLVTAWNPGELDEMALPPCHYSYQFYVHNDGRLSTLVNQRSADVFLGLPFDIASYATLTHMVAHVTGLKPGELIYNLGDTHIYLNHLEQVKTQLQREPYPLPQININKRNREIKSIDDFELEDFELVGYQHHPTIKGEVSV